LKRGATVKISQQPSINEQTIQGFTIFYSHTFYARHRILRDWSLLVFNAARPIFCLGACVRVL
jgi:hypothetical protein